MHIRKATIADIKELIPLFEGYRKFYKQPLNPEGVRLFLTERFIREESIIFIAFRHIDEKEATGFTQLYPLFSSVTMERMLLLNDLFIYPDHRSKGIGTSLIDKAKELCNSTQQKGIVLQTEKTNPAQELYEHLGFKKDPDLHYFWAR